MQKYSYLMKPNKQIILKVFIIFIIWRIFLSGLMIYSPLKAHELGNKQYNPVGEFRLENGSVKWDAFHYKKIARYGYGSEKSGLPAFYPLYPMLIASLHKLGMGFASAGLLINFIASYFAALFLYMLSLQFLENDEDATFALLLFLFFPMTVFSFALYTEALFCMLVFGSFYFAFRRKWLAANIFLAFATATRFPGLILAVVVFVEYLFSIKWSIRRPLYVSRDILYFILAPIGFVSYYLFLLNKYDDGLMMFNAYKYGWQYQRFNPNIFGTLLSYINNISTSIIHTPKGWGETVAGSVISLAYWIGTLSLTIYEFFKKNLPPSLLIFMTLSLLAFIINGNLVSVGRYVMPLFPIYIIVTKIFSGDKIKPYRGVLLGVSAITAGVMLVLFSNGYWIE